LVKVKKSRKKGDKYIIIEKNDLGIHISIHNSGHVHIKDKTGLHVEIDGLPKIILSKANLQKLFSEKGLIAIPCEKYPDCICIDLSLNPYMLEEGQYGELCLKLQKYFGGGLCPEYEGRLCIWAGLCRRKIDPIPYVKTLFG